jgi:hypothetical protein
LNRSLRQGRCDCVQYDSVDENFRRAGRAVSPAA